MAGNCAPLKVYGLWALHHGIPVGVLNFLEESPPPFPRLLQVLIATGEGAMWGRRCQTLLWLLADWDAKPDANDRMQVLRQAF